MVLKDNWVAGELYGHDDANDVADAVNQLAFNVKEYGAVGDGTTDDTAAIQNAIDDASAAGGGVVFFPQGAYKVTSLTLESYVSLKGVGGAYNSGNGSIIRTAATSGDMLSYSGSAGLMSVTISDLRLDGPGSGTGNGIRLQNTGGLSNPSVNIVFCNVKIYWFTGGTGIEADNLIVSVFDNVTTEACNTGFYLNVGTSITMSACYANSCLSTGFNLKSMYYSTLNSPAADGCGTAYLIDTCGSITLNSPGCEWQNPTVASPADGFKITGCHGVVLNNAYTFQNPHYSFWVTGSSVGVVFISPFENDPISATNSYKIDTGSYATFIGLDVTTAHSDAGTTLYLNDGGGNVETPGIVRANSVEVNTFNDVNGNILLAGVPWDAGAVNYVELENSPIGNGYFAFKAAGADTNVSIVWVPKGAGVFQVNAGARTAAPIAAFGSLTNVDLDLQTKAAGVVRANGNPVGVKVAVPATATSTGVVGQWAADASFHYTCTATNTWRRVAIASW